MSTLKDNLHRHMNKLCLEIGSKHCGSPELEKAGIYIEEQLKSFGLDTRREKMEVIGWNYQGFRLWNVTDNRAVPDATTCYFSNNVEIYDHPLWIREEDLNRLEDMNVAGRLCMVAAWYDMGNVFGYNSLAEKLDRLGAAAAIFLNRLHCQHAPLLISRFFARDPAPWSGKLGLEIRLPLPGGRYVTEKLPIPANRWEWFTPIFSLFF